MDNNVTISNSHESELQFDVSVEGTDVEDMQVRFVVKTKNINYSFLCKQGDEAAKWVVTIPAMKQLKSGDYDFVIEVITNGYYFDPYKGKVEVAPTPTVKAASSKPQKPVVKVSSSTDEKPKEKADEKKVEKKPEKKVEKKQETKESTETKQLVDAFLKRRENKPPLTEKEKAVKEALKQFKSKPLDIKKVVGEKVKVESTNILPKAPNLAKKEPTAEPRRSNLESVIEQMGIPKDEQAKKVQDIINSTKDTSDED